MKLNGKKIVIGITAGIAAYKIANLIRLLKKDGAEVFTIMTEEAKAFIGPITIQALSGHKPLSNTFEPESENGIDHINIISDADLLVIAPATANTIAKIRVGIADNLLTSTALAAPCPIMLAPAMNVHMLNNKATLENISILKERGYIMVGPDNGFQACGETGNGRMSEPEVIHHKIVETMQPRPQVLEGKKVVITAGPTVENIDPVRFISNRSSGKMGFALAKAAKALGADVYLVTGPVQLNSPDGVNRIDINTADEMLQKVRENIAQTDIFIACAAVADFKMKEIYNTKIKKTDDCDSITLTLVKNPDILAQVGHSTNKPTLVVGFAAETNNIEEHALKKLNSKGADFIIANDVSLSGLGFGSDYNKITIYAHNDAKIEFEPNTKSELGNLIMEFLAHKLQ